MHVENLTVNRRRLFVIIIFCVRAHVSGCSQPFVSCSVQFTVILYLLFAFLFPNKTILKSLVSSRHDACNERLIAVF